MSKTRRRQSPRELDLDRILDSVRSTGDSVRQMRTIDGVTINGRAVEVKTDREYTGAVAPVNEHIAKTGSRAGRPKAAFNSAKEALIVASSHGNHNPDAAYKCSVCGKWHLG